MALSGLKGLTLALICPVYRPLVPYPIILAAHFERLLTHFALFFSVLSLYKPASRYFNLLSLLGNERTPAILIILILNYHYFNVPFQQTVC